MVSTYNLPIIVDYLDQDSCLKLLDTQIAKNSGLAPVHPAGYQTREEAVTVPLGHGDGMFNNINNNDNNTTTNNNNSNNNNNNKINTKV